MEYNVVKVYSAQINNLIIFKINLMLFYPSVNDR